jgi:hypothetical protein
MLTAKKSMNTFLSCSRLPRKEDFKECDHGIMYLLLLLLGDPVLLTTVVKEPVTPS